MDQIVCYTRSAGLRKRLAGLEGYSTIVVDTTADLAERLVEEHDVVSAVVHIPREDAFWMRLLASLQSSFPLLDVVIVVEQGTVSQTGRAVLLQGNPDDPVLFDRIAGHVRQLEKKDQRRRQRFDWPLVGELRTESGTRHRLRVRAISSSGAFLENEGSAPEPGTIGTLSIEFQDFCLLSGCEVLQQRPPAGRLPAGFGVRFTDLTEASRKVVDSIVQDELVRSLVEPGSPPRPPAIVT